MKIKESNKPVVLCIMDGWGLNHKKKNNAVALAKKPNYDYFLNNFPNSKLQASGRFVGLPEGQIGNSEVGHMNLGSGRVILQSLPKINFAFKQKTIEKNKNFVQFLKNHPDNKTIHVLGLFSDGGVHSHKDHIIEISKLLSKNKKNFCLHLFSDGRDASPYELGENIKSLAKDLPSFGKICTLIGRYYSMDRDNRWERIKKCYDLIVEGRSDYKFNNIIDATKSAYKRKETDEFISPTIVGEYTGVNNGDSLLIVNFRSDRVRQLLDSLLNPDFKHFEREKKLIPFKNSIGMWEYSEKLNKFMKCIFKNEVLKDTLGEVISKSGLSQLRLAETEKYAHVTFFFNGGNEKKYINEDRIMIPSPRISTYDLKPEMSAKKIEEKLVFSIKNHKYDLIIVNFANPDMVGHTGNLASAIKAVETVDSSIGNLKKAIDKTHGVILLTADHGNCEIMWDEKKNSPHTAHTANTVPLILISSKKNNNFNKVILKDGKLANIASTILEILELPPQKYMESYSLISKN